MNKVIITADSGIDPTNKQYMIPIQLINPTGTTAYRDNGLELNLDKILEDYKKGIYYKTSAPLPNDYYDMWKRIVEQGDDIVHLSMSGKLSSTSVLLSNSIASELNDIYGKHIYVVDTLNCVSGGTFLFEMANKLRDEGYSASDIASKLDIDKTSIKTSFYVPNPTGFLRSGRNSKAFDIAEMAINKLNLKFRVDLNEDGTLAKKSIYRGKNTFSLYKMLNEVLDNDKTSDHYIRDDIDLDEVVIGGVKEEEVQLDNVVEYLKDKGFSKVLRQDFNGSFAVYACPDLMSVSYKVKK